MPPTIISTDYTGAGPVHTFTGSDDELEIAVGTTIVTTGPAISWGFGTGNQTTIYGSVTSGGMMDIRGNGASLVIAAGAELTLTYNDYSRTGLNAYAGTTIYNHGTVSAPHSVGAGLWDTGRMLNTGSLSGSMGAALAAGSDGAALSNSGSIVSTGYAGMAALFHAGVLLAGANGTFYNMAGGTVRAQNEFGAGVVIYNFGGNYIQNHGTILSDHSYGIDLSQVDASNTGSRLFNRGEITGGNGVSYNGSAGAEHITNRGDMNGDVVMGAGNDTIDNRAGTITGDWFGGEGDDYYLGHLNTTVTGTIYGGEGNDTLLGGDNSDRINGDAGDDLIHGMGGDDLLYGGEGNDTLAGQAGDDEVHGDAGNDLISGGDGNDTLYGGADNDTLHGNEGADHLYGGEGNDHIAGHAGDDHIEGGAGNDVMTGGLGNDSLFGGEGTDFIYGNEGDDALYGGGGGDRLYGGTGADTFVFQSAAETPVDVAGRAWIMDFTAGEDRIDLSQIDADSVSDSHQAFTFIGNTAFSGTAGELRYDRATWLVTGDTDGDGVADFSIVLAHGPTGVTAVDFILV